MTAAAAEPEVAAPPGAVAQMSEVEAVADRWRESRGEHQRLPFRAVARTDSGGEMAELMDQRRHELVGVAIEQRRVELDRRSAEVGAPET